MSVREELENQVAELQSEVAALKQELDAAQENVPSSQTSEPEMQLQLDLLQQQLAGAHEAASKAKLALEVEKRTVEQLNALLRSARTVKSTDELKRGASVDGAKESSKQRTSESFGRSSSESLGAKPKAVPERLASFASSISSTTSSRRSSFTFADGKPKVDKRQKRIAKMLELQNSKAGGKGQVALGFVPMEDPADAVESVTGWAAAAVTDWNQLITLFDEVRTEVEELKLAASSYRVGLSTAAEGELDLAEAFLRMAQQLNKSGTDEEQFLGHAEHFQDVRFHLISSFLSVSLRTSVPSSGLPHRFRRPPGHPAYPRTLPKRHSIC